MLAFMNPKELRLTGSDSRWKSVVLGAKVSWLHRHRVGSRIIVRMSPSLAKTMVTMWNYRSPVESYDLSESTVWVKKFYHNGTQSFSSEVSVTSRGPNLVSTRVAWRYY